MKNLLLLILITVLSITVARAGAPVATMSTTVVTEAGGQILPENVYRKSVVIKAQGAVGEVTLKLDSAPANGLDGYIVSALSNATSPSSLELPARNAVYGKSNEPAGTEVVIIEYLQ